MRYLLAERAARLLLGLFLYGIGIAMMVRAGIGLAPWDVLTQGISMRTGLSFGLVTVLVGVGVLALWIPLREKFGVGTVLNALLIGPSAELGLWAIPDAHGVVAQAALFGAGLVLLAAATGLYIGARFGSGPRDGLMTGLHARTCWPSPTDSVTSAIERSDPDSAPPMASRHVSACARRRGSTRSSATREYAIST